MDSTQAIIELTENVDPEVRKLAAEYLITTDDRNIHIIDALAKGLSDSESGVKDICFRGLASMGGDYALETAKVVSKIIINDNIELRNLAGDILLKLGHDSAVALLPYLNDSDQDVRKYACDIIGLVGDETMIESIILLDKDEDPNVVASVFEALGNIGSESSIDYLKAQLDLNEDLQPLILEAIGKIGGQDAQRFLLDKLKDTSDIFLQSACIDALAFSAEDSGICDLLMDELPNAPENMKVILLKTIIAIAFRQERQIVLPENLRYIAREALIDDDDDIRMAGLFSLGDEYFAEDIPGLAFEMKQNNPDTRQMILYNILMSGNHQLISEFFSEIITPMDVDNHNVDVLSDMIVLSEEIQPENMESSLMSVSKVLLLNPRGHLEEIFELMLRINYNMTIKILKDIFDTGNDDIKNEINQLLNALGINDF